MRYSRKNSGQDRFVCVLYAGMDILAPGEEASDGTRESRHNTAISEECSRSKKNLRDVADRLCAFHARFCSFFTSRTRNVVEQSRKYLFGLILSDACDGDALNLLAFQFGFSALLFDNKNMLQACRRWSRSPPVRRAAPLLALCMFSSYT